MAIKRKPEQKGTIDIAPKVPKVDFENLPKGEVRPVPEVVAPEIPKQAAPVLPQGSVIREQGTGRVTGVKLPDGRTFIGLKPKDITALIDKFKGSKKFLGTEFQEAGTQAIAKKQEEIATQEAQSLMEQRAGAIEQVLQFRPNEVTPEDEFDMGRALIAATEQAAGLGVVGGVAKAGLSSAGVGGGAGLAAAGPIAAVGAGLGFIKGFIDDVKRQNKEQVGIAMGNANQAATNIGKVTTAVTRGMNANDAATYYNQQKSEIYKQYSIIKRETETSLDRFKSDGVDELDDIETLIQQTLPILEARFLTALANPTSVQAEAEAFEFELEQ